MILGIDPYLTGEGEPAVYSCYAYIELGNGCIARSPGRRVDVENTEQVQAVFKEETELLAQTLVAFMRDEGNRDAG